jgi:predicted enzyme related to lactoylglutathione lyase
VGSSVYSVTIDCADPKGLASFWEQVLDYKRTHDGDEEVVIEPRSGSGDALLFLEVPDVKQVKNRIHFDLKPTDQAAEVERVKKLGATEVDIGQGDVTWVVLADPEGNEFCILRPR